MLRHRETEWGKRTNHRWQTLVITVTVTALDPGRIKNVVSYDCEFNKTASLFFTLSQTHFFISAADTWSRQRPIFAVTALRTNRKSTTGLHRRKHPIHRLVKYSCSGPAHQSQQLTACHWHYCGNFFIWWHDQYLITAALRRPVSGQARWLHSPLISELIVSVSFPPLSPLFCWPTFLLQIFTHV